MKTLYRHIENHIFCHIEIRPCTKNIVRTSFEVLTTFLCIFVSVFRVFVRYESWVNLAVAIFFGTVDRILAILMVKLML